MRKLIAILVLCLSIGGLGVVLAEHTSVGDVRAANKHEPLVHAQIVHDRTRGNGLRIVDATYVSPYGRRMQIKVLAPRAPGRTLPFVWRFAPSFWARAPRCQPFTRSEPARWHFVYVCVSIDDRSGRVGDHAFGDPKALREALRLRGAIEQIVKAEASKEIIIGSSASSVDALDAVGIEPHRFQTAVIFDSPTNLAARYWDLSKGPRKHTVVEYGGPPTGSRRGAYLNRSPIARLKPLAATSTDLRFYMSRTDQVACDPQQMPVFLHLLARDRGTNIPVMMGTWQHGLGWSDYAAYEMRRLGIAPATTPVNVPEVRIVRDGGSEHFGCSLTLH